MTAPGEQECIFPQRKANDSIITNTAERLAIQKDRNENSTA